MLRYMSNIIKKALILRVAVPSPLRRVFDYLLPAECGFANIKPGMRVLVPFGRQEIIGVVLEVATESKLELAKLKPVLAVLDDEPLLPKTILNLITWVSNYYHHPIGDVVSNALPSFLREKTCIKKYACNKEELLKKHSKNPQTLQLNESQKHAVTAIKKHINEFKTFLLDGVTGSGKTEVYLRVIAEIIAAKKQALVLVPEINLTPQTISRFSECFSVPIAVFHSRLTPRERLRSWLMAKDGVASIIIGTRSAIFAPLKNPGIIIIDEEHDLSFKQQSGLRYSARDLATMRGKLENIPVVLGSATPCLESFYNVKRKRYVELTLPERAGNAIHPSFHLVDMRNQKLKSGIAENLLSQIKKHLANNGQVLIFLNRRGFAPILICHHCGWVAGCKHCDARLTQHQKKHHLRCHHCGAVEKIPTKCPKCDSENLLSLGTGTERVEAALQDLLPEAKLIRIDRDTTRRKNSLEEMLKNIHSQEYQILVGTQMLAKGHHFPDVTMVAILNVDQGLFSADFRASEHLAQLIMQVAGRAGRAQKPGEVYLQTHNPQHPLLLNLINKGYSGFVNNCLQERQAAQLPPYSYLALLHVESKEKEAALKFLILLCSKVENSFADSIEIFGPIPAVMERKAGYFRAQLLLQSKNRQMLQQALDVLLGVIDELKPKRSLRWFLDIDPVELSG
jgi:primosomal protein N' (replication factor Y) (superfamily II helicase)